MDEKKEKQEKCDCTIKRNEKKQTKISQTNIIPLLIRFPTNNIKLLYTPKSTYGSSDFNFIVIVNIRKLKGGRKVKVGKLLCFFLRNRKIENVFHQGCEVIIFS